AAAPTADVLATPVLVVDAADRLVFANPACSAWLGLGARRLQGLDAAALEAQPLPLPELAARARAAPAAVCARRQQLAGAGTRFADVWASPLGSEGAVQFEFHPTDEFPGEDPATLLPAALSAALRGLAHEVRNPLAG